MFSCVIDRYKVFYRNLLKLAKLRSQSMWIIIFIIAILFVLGGLLLLLRSAKMPVIPDGVKAQPYEDDD
ncbi:MAG: hypothetical protein D0531_11030 [Methylococcales bacterium]|nr:MAG: hypothetical protein D0531_11030 [Methylococcales bacterium]